MKIIRISNFFHYHFDNMIKPSSLQIRPGSSVDFPLYEQWHNTLLEFPKILKNQGDESTELDLSTVFQSLISQDSHLESKLYVIEADAVPVAQVHLERLESDIHPDPTYGFYLFLHPEFRGQGLGKKVIRLAAKYLIKEKQVAKLAAHIHRKNTLAILCFAKAKFQFVKATVHQGAYCQEYRYQALSS